MFQGSFVALVTPFDEQGQLDVSSLERLVQFHLDAGTDGIVVAGTTGESATLSFDEHVDLIGQVVKFVGGKVLVIGGSGSNSTREAVELTRAVKGVGVDACLLISPYYNKPSQEGIFQHYSAVADAVDVPQFVYNVPGRTACDVLPSTVARLAEHPNIVGVKEAVDDMGRVKTLLEETPEDFVVLSGDDETALEAMVLGANGVISVTANVAPRMMHELCEKVLGGDVDSARAIHDKLLSLHKVLFVESNPIPVKWAMVQLGFCQPFYRLPLTPLDESFHEVVGEAMKGVS